MQFDPMAYMERKALAESLLGGLALAGEARRLVQAAVELNACGRRESAQALLNVLEGLAGRRNAALLVDPGTLSALRQGGEAGADLAQLLRIVAVAGLLGGEAPQTPTPPEGGADARVEEDLPGRG